MRNTIHYITYNDTYSGIYQSQVIDVVKHLNLKFDVEVRLIAFVPIRLWNQQRKIITSKLPEASVYPVLGALDKVKRTSRFLKIISNKQFAICRGPLAFLLTKGYYRKVVYDGRAAVEAEVTEYNVTGHQHLDELFIRAENFAINNADYFISVSKKLVEYWEEKLGHKISHQKYSIIPCTLTSLSHSSTRRVDSENVRVVYAGGTGAWQSFEKVVGLLDELMAKQANLEVLFLTKENPHLLKLLKKYPDRSERKWVAHDEVFNELSSCDYGILLREDRVTNSVASPVKFAEYLNAGLKVLISPNIGDFSEFVKKNDCGIVIEDKIPFLEKNIHHKELAELCEVYFYKCSKNIAKEYAKMLSRVN
ncbi:MAG: hypothetical protein N4A35_07315 [Flavobacteriales bacterium]|jgi:glycosyltransferase involved in cell wall biosynthesis|nr:hypothetical protein [Flavobacteriales bacterium]